MSPTPSQSLEAKIVVLGAAGVGKTSLLTRFIHGTFLPSSSVPSTVGATFLTKRLTFPDDPATTLRLQIWDTAGQERFRSISKLYYRGANAALLCYDITDEKSFEDMTRWLAELRENLGEECVIHVVGTKADVVAEDPRKRQVGFERCIKYVAEHLQKQQSGGGLASSIMSTATTASSSLPSSSLTTTTATTMAATTTKEKRPPTPPTTLTHPAHAHSHTQSHHHNQPPSSTRSSAGFWGSDTCWDCCHEISAKDGEGVDEVFRVIARKLVDQQLLQLQLQNQERERERRRAEGAASEKGALMAGAGGGVGARRFIGGGGGGGLDGGGMGMGDGRGSFRLGPSGSGGGDKRRSWLGLTSGSAYSSSEGTGEQAVGVRQVYGERQGRCC